MWKDKHAAFRMKNCNYTRDPCWFKLLAQRNQIKAALPIKRYATLPKKLLSTQLLNSFFFSNNSKVRQNILEAFSHLVSLSAMKWLTFNSHSHNKSKNVTCS